MWGFDITEILMIVTLNRHNGKARKVQLKFYGLFGYAL